MTGPIIDEHYVKMFNNYLYFYFHYNSPNLNYGMRIGAGWVVQIKIWDDKIESDKNTRDGNAHYVLSPYIWNKSGDPNDKSITQLNNSLSFRDVHNNGWESQSLEIFQPLFFPDFFCFKVPLRLLAPKPGNLDYQLYILDTTEGNKWQPPEYSGDVIG